SACLLCSSIRIENSDRSMLFSSRLNLLNQRHVIIFADALQNQKCRGGVSSIRHQMRPPSLDAIAGTRRESKFFVRVLQKQADISLDDIERIINVVVKMPRDFLCR